MTYDFLIIGAGIAGLSVAAELAALGSVLVLEREAHPAHHASGRSAALYEPRYGLPPVAELSLASEAAFRALPGILSERGLMILAKADQRATFDRDLAGFQLEEIGVEAACGIVPILNPATVAFAATASHAWDIDTDLLIQGHIRRLKAGGGELRTSSPVSALRRAGGLWHVTTAMGEIAARVLINAAGAWVGQVAGMAGLRDPGFTPLRRSMARIAAPGARDISRWPMLFGCGESWYAKPDAGALIVSPAEEDPLAPQDAWADDMVLAEGLARYEEMVTEPVTRPLANWAGLRTFSPDRVPVIGPDPAEPAFFWLAGQGGYGFQTSPAAARLVAALLGGTAPDVGADLAARLSPTRFA
ncbi:glycine/D-amino acid oxidase-like deaminating enzyme [Gemmobacter caeni]|uniref:Glycine/D-amino acid oxidase-like deaminating enzyme n=1 Tax=Gemmobacter caeni TaxID=589035 RepID=A0A2T6AS01_9RHOB|nr:FAD-binding oxidoreductase [Gemmobacter caeni]PTX46592.1 glycine/D-amino acid oxidase-like deaminating enzyme [Gemmobacter caeni]TWI95441.1 glycine/D-amino acid oxidase-like deaminating enzyme [Gemmobacter caeni]